MTSFVLSVRDLESNDVEGAARTFGGKFGGVSYLAIPDTDNIPDESHKKSGAREWMDLVTSTAVAAAQAYDLVFFVHGYNTDPEEALKRQRLVEKNLNGRNYRCIVIGFDWPTAGSAALYEYDRSEAANAASFLVKSGIVPFAKYSTPHCAINVHVLAHSMGGYVVREAFRSLDKVRDAGLPNDWRIGQLVLFAADISSNCFELGNSEMLPVFAHSGRLTNYFSGYDKALAVSNVKNLDISSRVGRVGMPVDTSAHEKAVDVDCGPRYAEIDEDKRAQFKVIDGMVSHSWYLEDEVWYNDLAFTLQGQIDRNSIPSRSYVGHNDFVLNKT